MSMMYPLNAFLASNNVEFGPNNRWEARDFEASVREFQRNMATTTGVKSSMFRLSRQHHTYALRRCKCTFELDDDGNILSLVGISEPKTIK